MSRRDHTPAHLRYLKARLWNLARPSFWGALIFLSVVGLAIKEYWTNPDFFTNWQKNQVATNQPVNSSISEEDRAIAADIDNLPVLFNSGPDQEKLQAATTLDPKQKTQPKNNKGLLETLNSKNPSSSDAKTKDSVKEANSVPEQKLENPFVVQAENLLRLPNIQSGSKPQETNTLTPYFGQQNSVDLGTGLAPQTRLNQNPASESALQKAVNQSKNQSQPNLNGITSTQNNPFASELSPENRSGQNLIPNTGSSRNTTNNTLNTGTSSTQSGLISGTGYTQSGITNQPQNFFSGTGYPQPSFNNLQPQNIIPGTGYTQQGVTNQLQNPISRTGYPQPQPGLIDIPQTPSAVPNNSTNILNPNRRSRLNNINNVQPLPSVAQPTLLAPPTSATSINPYYTPQNQGGVISNTTAIPNNYGNSFVQQAPASVPQSIYSSPGQIPGQYTGGGQIRR